MNRVPGRFYALVKSNRAVSVIVYLVKGYETATNLRRLTNVRHSAGRIYINIHKEEPAGGDDMSGTNMLVVLLLVGIFARSDLIAIAAGVLLIAKLINLNLVFPILEKRGLETGLLFLLMAILAPLADGTVSMGTLFAQLISPLGLTALAGGVLATHLNSEGIALMKKDPGIVLGLVTGSIFGILFLHGIPVGPLTAAGLGALFIEAAGLVRRPPF
jgi:uncharacterized membrane protein (DUF441 family)